MTDSLEPAGESLAGRAIRGGEVEPEFARYVLDETKLSPYTQLPPTTVAEMFAVLDSLKQRLIVPTARLEEFETAVRDAGMDGQVAVIGSLLLREDQVFLAASEAQMQEDFRAAADASIVEAVRDRFGWRSAGGRGDGGRVAGDS